MASKSDYEVGLVLNELSDEFDVDQEDVTFGGGGKGQTASVDGAFVGKGTSRLAAVQDLLAQFKAERADSEPEEAEADEDEEGCSEECQNASPNSVCTCRCGGKNHPREEGATVVVYGSKQCACGCGQETKRKYVPGHDARHHFALRAEALGLTPEALRKQLKAERNKKGAAARKAKRAAVKATEAKAAAVVAALPTKTPRSRKPKDGEEGPESLKRLLVIK